METSAALKDNVNEAFETVLQQVSSALLNAEFDANKKDVMDTITLHDLKKQGLLPQSAEKDYHQRKREVRRSCCQ